MRKGNGHAADGLEAVTGSVDIRLALDQELERLQDIERSAGAAFAGIGMDEIAEDQPPERAQLRRFLSQQQLWVAVQGGAPVGYIMIERVDGCAHIEQVSVHASAQGAGLGRRLIEQVTQWARCQGLAAVTLTTFADVPWNAPYYERLGFQRLNKDELTPGLAAIRQHEAELGLDRWPRVCMRKPC